MAEHDPSYKLLFSHREMVADLIRGFVREDWVAELDFGTLERVLLPARVPGADIPNVIELQEMQAMLAERVKTWTEEWKQQGIQQGMAQGMHLGETKVLHRLLAHRFGALPPWVDERLEQAGERDLERWTERVLDCETLDDVFD